LIAGAEGNVSIRVDDDRVLITPAGITKADVRPDDLVEVTLAGVAVRRRQRASTEIAIHLRIYLRRPDVRAVVHAHPPAATGFAVAGESLMEGVLPEVIFSLGSVPLVPYSTPGTVALADRFDPYLAEHDAFLMANHGATTVGPTLVTAHQRMESLEQAARILLTARLLGRVNTLTTDDVRALIALRERASDRGSYTGSPLSDEGRSEHGEHR
jgi:L-fuculose-phosphate aldolase